MKVISLIPVLNVVGLNPTGITGKTRAITTDCPCLNIMYCHVHFCVSSRLQREGVSISICDALKKTIVNLRCERIVNADNQSIRIANAGGQPANRGYP